MTRVYAFVNSIGAAAHYPSTLFALGNTALAYHAAGPFGILANMTITAAVFGTKVFEHFSGQRIGIPFGVLGTVNVFTAFSIEMKLVSSGIPLLSLQPETLSAHIAALAFIIWAIGHFLVSMHQRNSTTPKNVATNPQTFYGFSDITSIHAAGVVNWWSLPFAIIGFIKSFFIARPIVFQKEFYNDLYAEITPARLYGLSYLIGALISTGTPAFAFAQLCWALAYFHFKKYA